MKKFQYVIFLRIVLYKLCGNMFISQQNIFVRYSEDEEENYQITQKIVYSTQRYDRIKKYSDYENMGVDILEHAQSEYHHSNSFPRKREKSFNKKFHLKKFLIEIKKDIKSVILFIIKNIFKWVIEVISFMLSFNKSVVLIITEKTQFILATIFLFGKNLPKSLRNMFFFLLIGILIIKFFNSKEV